jgi:hypothetical protein
VKGLKGFFVSFVLALSIFPALAFSRDVPVQGQNKQTILDIENEWLRALVEHDRSTLDKILADDFLDSSWKGKLRTKAQVLKELVAARSYSQHLQDIEVQLHEAMAIARGLNEIKENDGRVVMCIRFTDVFVYRHGSWQAVAAQETPVSSQ